MAETAVSLAPSPQVRNPIPARRDGAQLGSPARAVSGFARDGAEQPPSLASQYRKLKELDAVLDSTRDTLSHAQHLYQETLKAFAILCHQLWEREKAQGNHQGKGFRLKLQALGIKVGRAYRSMKKFFPSDFPAQRKSLIKKKIAASFAADEGVGLRFTGKLPQGKEALECTFVLTPAEKAEITESLKLVDAARVQQLFLQALKQAARQPVTHHNQAETANQKSEIINNEALCSGVSLDGAPPVSAAPNTQKSKIENQQSQSSSLSLEAGVAALRSWRNAVYERASASGDPLASRGPL